MTPDDLRAFGADVDTGMARCMDNEAFYLKLVNSVKQEKKFDVLEESIAAGDLDAAFEAAHSLKGVLGNLSLTPLYEPVNEITELIFKLKEQNRSIVLIEHNLPLTMRVCDRITVLSYGKKICEGTPEYVKNDEQVIEAYLGKEDED